MSKTDRTVNLIKFLIKMIDTLFYFSVFLLRFSTRPKVTECSSCYDKCNTVYRVNIAAV